MWLTSSSIGRKLVMAVTGVCLVLFVTFHVLMNSVALIWPAAYNQICEFLGANWYVLVASAGLALLFIIHIIYALWLTLQNRKARGTDRYAVTSRPPQVEWSSKNMLVLGIVVVAFLVVHLIQFWYRMQFQEMCSHNPADWFMHDGAPVPPAFGTLFLQMAFSEIYTPVIYIIGFVALWFHMNHGFWSMLHTIGWNNNVWIERLKKIGCWWTSIVVVLFIAQAVLFTIQARDGFFEKNIALQEQYGEYWGDQAEKIATEFTSDMAKAMSPAKDRAEQMSMRAKFVSDNGVEFIKTINFIDSCVAKQCPDIAVMKLEGAKQFKQQVEYMTMMQGVMSNK